MRIELVTRSITLTPGSTGTVDLDVFNTGETIDGVTGRIVGLDEACEGMSGSTPRVASSPDQLALFPDTSGRLQLRVTLPAEFPAGTHVFPVEVVSSVDPSSTGSADLEMIVEPLTRAELVLVPAALRGTRKGRFTLQCENTGNTPVSLSFTATDPERALRYEFEPSTLEVPPGQKVNGGLNVQGRRPLFGHDASRPITVLGENVDLQLEAHATFSQRAEFPRGLLTMLALAAIVSLWAGALLLGLSKVLSQDSPGKAVPASFFAGVPGGVNGDGNGNGNAPPGAVSKTGAASKDLGGTVTGTVRAANTQAGVGRITVEAIREGKNGPQLVSSAATQDDGTYAVPGLLPGRYEMRFSASGYQDTWYTSASDIAGAQPVLVQAVSQTKGVDATVTGLPGSISGKVDPGASAAPVPVSVSIRPIVDNVPGPALSTTQTDASQQFSINSLATPGSYELTFSAPGYQPTTSDEQLQGGEALVTNTVELSAGGGSITGLVTDGVNPLGGVVVTAIAGDTSVSSATPTSGSIGRYTIGGLASPQTYLLTFSLNGFGSETAAVDLAPGENRTGVDIVLTGGTGSVSGRAVDEAGNGIGDVVVTITGGSTSLTTHTLTAGAQGSYFLSGLPTPGDYAVTFTAPGRATQTVPVLLSSSGLATNVNATLPSTLAILQGNVINGSTGAGLSGATITVTDGTNVRTTTSADAPTGGFFEIDGLQPGTYAVTIDATGFNQRTSLVTLGAGENRVLDPPDATVSVT
jgi:hypothetical protein